MGSRRFAAATLAAFMSFTAIAGASDAPEPSSDARAVPRYVSLKAAGANGRHGPGLEHRIDWVYQRPGLPLQVTGESGPWRRVRDPDGGESWMHARNLDEHRSFYVTAADAPLRTRPRENAEAIAYLAAGVSGDLTGCDGEWRRVAVRGRVGWVRVTALWGADDCAGL